MDYFSTLMSDAAQCNNSLTDQRSKDPNRSAQISPQACEKLIEYQEPDQIYKQMPINHQRAMLYSIHC